MALLAPFFRAGAARGALRRRPDRFRGSVLRRPCASSRLCMETRDLLLLIGFLRAGKMFPLAVPQPDLPAQRSLRIVLDVIAEQERQLFGGPVPLPPGSQAAPPSSAEPPSTPEQQELRRRTALTSWSGDFLLLT